MSERINHLQLELFSQEQKNFSQTRLSGQDKFIFKQIKSYEKTILVIIAILITGIFSFSLGVEKGKRFARKTPSAPSDNKSDEAMANTQVPAQPKIDKKEAAEPLVGQDKWQYYTIQLASYLSKSAAEKEAQDLKKKGLLPVVSSKGKYTVLYVGNFPDKKNALSLLSELKKRYRDCFIRRL